MKKIVKYILLAILLLLTLFFLKWLFCPTLCSFKYPKQACFLQDAECPYSACASNCFLLCVKFPGSDPICLFPNPFWMSGLSN